MSEDQAGRQLAEVGQTARSYDETTAKTSMCACGLMTIEECAWMPTRHCGLWDVDDTPDDPNVPQPADAMKDLEHG